MQPGESAPNVDAVTFDRPCVGCGYNLRGLRSDGACPECGKPVADSLRGDLLRFAAPEYLASLHRGVFLVVASIIAQIISMMLIFIASVVGAALTAGGGGGGAKVAGFLAVFPTIGGGLSVLFTFVTLFGWWKLSEPDPGYTGRDDGSKSRLWLRILVIVQATGAVVNYIFSILFPMAIPALLAGLGGAGPGGAGGGAGGGAMAGAAIGLGIVAIVIAILSGLAWAAAFFLQMIYVRWLAVRVPDEWIDKRAKLLLWLGPLLYVVGSLCIGLGPLIALILYWNMLDRLRKGIKAVRLAQGSLAA